MLRQVILILFLISLNGCALAPGMSMNTPASTEFNHVQPKFVPITAALISRMIQEREDYRDDANYYHIGLHDVLNIYVWGHPELSGPKGAQSSEQGLNSALNPTMSATGYLVDPDGYIFFPMIGKIHVAGSTPDYVRVELTSLLKKYIRNPQMDIRVTGFRSKKVYVLGEVLKPGIQPITDSPISIMDAINLSGGLDPKSADPSHIFVIRGDYARPTVYWLDANSPDELLLAENFKLLSQDVVFISTANVTRWNRVIDQVFPSLQTALLAYSVSTTH